jgi:predicted phosphodiesterase
VSEGLSSVFENLRQLLEAPDTDEPALIKPVAVAKLPKIKAPKQPKETGSWKLCVLLPDAQIGFRRYADNVLDPFHDVTTLQLAYTIMTHLEKEYGIDLVVNLGDTMDLPMFGKYEQEVSFARTVQATLQAGHNYMAMQRAISPEAEIVFIEGNHDCRLERHIRSVSPALQELRQIDNDDYPVLSMPHLMQFDALNITYAGAYPAAEFWSNKRLVAVHGTRANSNGSTSVQYANKQPLHSTVFGHSHRSDLYYKTHHTASGPVENVAFSPGCLCRIDGAVPSVKGGVGMNERPAIRYEDWQQGMAVVWYKDDGDFDIQPIHIHGAGKMERWAVYAGKEFRVPVE